MFIEADFITPVDIIPRVDPDLFNQGCCHFRRTGIKMDIGDQGETISSGANFFTDQRQIPGFTYSLRGNPHHFTAGIRQGDWKLITARGKQPAQLFNLKSDPYEKSDLAATQPDKVKELVALLEKVRRG